MPAVEGVDTLPIPLLTEPAPPPVTLGVFSLSHFANRALTRSEIDREVGSPQESFESDVEEVSSVFLLPAGALASAASSSDSLTAVAAAEFGTAAGGFLAEEATCSSPSLGSCGRSEALALMAIIGGGAYLSPPLKSAPPWRSPPKLGLFSGGDLRQPGVVGDLRRGSALGRCRDEGFADGAFGEGVAAAVDGVEPVGVAAAAVPEGDVP